MSQHKGKGRILLLASAIALALPLATQAQAQAAPEISAEKKQFDIPAGSLADALSRFSEQAGIQVLYEPDLVEGKRVAAFRGTATAREALRRLLGNSGVVYEFVSSDTAVLKYASPATPAPRPRRLDDEAVPPAEKNEVTELETIVVTGTNIRSVVNETMPIQSFDREVLDRTGYSTTQDFFRSLPQNFSGGSAGATEDGILGSGTSRALNLTSNASGVNLRGLGNSSTLVLLNGHRMAPSNFGTVVDVSLIPFSAIDRVEVLTDGSSAIYGSDAVAGVVNIFLRKDYSGSETRARFGTVTNGGKQEYLLAHTFGAYWDTGHALISAQYQDRERLKANKRDATSSIPGINDIYPSTKSYGLVFNGGQSLSDRLELYTDILLSRRESDRITQQTTVGSINEYGVDARTVNANVGARYDLGEDWSISLNGQYSRQSSDTDQTVKSATTPIGQSRNALDFAMNTVDAVASGSLFETTAGPVSLAFGGSYRHERFEQDATLVTGAPLDRTSGRSVYAAFGELYAPLVGERSEVPFVRQLDISLAVRREHYSDFGSTTNPRFGVLYSPFDGLKARASYSTSFRSPSAIEKLGTANADILFVLPFPGPAGGDVPVLIQAGSQPLRPERAKTLSVGFDYEPTFFPGFTFQFNYYNIRYRDRILTPPSPADLLLRNDIYGSLISGFVSDADAQSFVDAAVSDGAQFFDDGTGVTGVRYLADLRQQNVAALRQSGYDISASFSRPLPDGALNLRATASVINKIKTSLTSEGAQTDILNSFGNPVDFRLRFDAGWSNEKWSFNAAVNRTGGYTNDTLLARPRIKPWMTVDLFASANLTGADSGRPLTLNLSVQNIFDKGPPFVDARGAFVNVRYDPANATPLGRFVAFELMKRW